MASINLVCHILVVNSGLRTPDLSQQTNSLFAYLLQYVYIIHLNSPSYLLTDFSVIDQASLFHLTHISLPSTLI